MAIAEPHLFEASGGVWAQLRVEAMQAAAEEPLLASYLHASILHHDRIEDALSYHLAQKLGHGDLGALQLREVIGEAYAADPAIAAQAARDMRVVRERDPACRTYLQPFLYFKGYGGLQAYRIAHWLWGQERDILAYHLQSRVSELFAVDIHPAAKIGAGVFIDHAHGIVIGETAVVEDDVSMLHSVTLGGTGKARRGPASENPPRRDDRRRRESARQHRSRRGRAHRRRFGGAGGRARALHGRRRAGQAGWRRLLRRA